MYCNNNTGKWNFEVLFCLITDSIHLFSLGFMGCPEPCHLDLEIKKCFVIIFWTITPVHSFEFLNPNITSENLFLCVITFNLIGYYCFFIYWWALQFQMLNSHSLTLLVFQPLDTASSKMQTSEFGKSKGLWKSLSETTWTEAFDSLGISLLLTANPSIQAFESTFI